MALFAKKWLWLALWAVGIVLILTVRTDSPWLRALLIAPLMVSAIWLVCDNYRRVHKEVKRLRGDA